jgi:hypothetical protein
MDGSDIIGKTFKHKIDNALKKNHNATQDNFKMISMPITHHNQKPDDSFTTTKKASQSTSANHSMLLEHQQQNVNSNSNSLGASDRISKEKQKFFRFSIFNSDRKSRDAKSSHKNDLKSTSSSSSKASPNLSSSANGHDKYEFVSSSDSETEKNRKCNDSKKKSSVGGNEKSSQKLLKSSAKSKNASNLNNIKLKSKLFVASSDENNSNSSCCSSDDDDDSSCESTSSFSETSSDENQSTANEMRASNLNKIQKSNKYSDNRTEAINTLNVFACINSRDLDSSLKQSNCWTVPFVNNNEKQTELLFRKNVGSESSPFGTSSKAKNEVWGFAAEAKKECNIFNAENNSCSYSKNDLRKPFTSLPDSIKLSDRAKTCVDANFDMNRKVANTRKHLLANEYFARNRRKTTLMHNNAIRSSDDELKNDLSPSKMFQKAVNYKRFDKNAAIAKKLDTNVQNNGEQNALHNNVPYESDHDIEPIANESTIKHSQSPYNNNNHNDLGKSRHLNKENIESQKKLLNCPKICLITILRQKHS